MYLIKLCWKNIWRNPVRSGVILLAVVLGIWAGIFSTAFYNGMMRERMRNQIDSYIGHIQIHMPGYLNEQLVTDTLPDIRKLIASLKKNPDISGIAAHTTAIGLASSAVSSYGVTISGIDPKSEPRVLDIDKYIIHGSYFGNSEKNSVVIGQALANRLKVKVGSKIVLTFQDIHHEIAAGAFRIAGIFQSSDKAMDETHLYVRAGDLQRLIGSAGAVQELYLRLKNSETSPEVAARLQKEHPGLEIQPWQTVAPDLQLLNDTMNLEITIIMGIIIFALILAILNTMLMAILERTHELGMLMAVGMSKLRVFGMIVTETVMLSFTGVPIGLGIAWLTIKLTYHTGIDLGFLAYGQQYGFSSVVRPEMDSSLYPVVAIMMIVAALLASFYPARKALKLRPIQAIRTW